MNRYLLLYCFLITLIFCISTFASATNSQEYLFAAFFLPLPLYFGNRLVKRAVARAKLFNYRRSQKFAAAVNPAGTPLIVSSSDPAIEGEVVGNPFPVRDVDKRIFLRLIASSGVALFIFSLFTKEAHGAFFGSVPGPGTVAVKDSTGNLIDPAEKQPTDGYEIAQLDDTSDPAFSYYGFVNKVGNWYVMREATTGAETGSYLYAAGMTDFATNWTGRALLTYTSFDLAF